MERLNDIMGRTTPRRSLPRQQMNAEQVTDEQEQQPGEAYTRPRYNQYPEPGAGSRSSLREPRPRQGQSTPTSQRAFSQGARQGQGGQGGYSYMEPNQRERRMAGDHRPSTGSAPRQGSYPRQRPLPDGSNYIPRQRAAEEQPLNRPTARPSASYHHSDSYQRTQGDVANEWEGEGDEDIVMEYGDWEGSEQEAAPYRRPERESNTRPDEGDYAFPTDAQLYGRDPRLTRGRSMYSTGTGQTQSPLHSPMPLARPQEMPPQTPYGTQRRTQPLDPQVLAEFERDQDISELPIRAPRIPRQPVMREREPAPSPALAPLPMPVPAARSVCPICKGAGYLRVDVPFGHPNFGKPVPCECKEAERKEKRRQQLIELSDLSAFHNKSFKNFNIRFQGIHPCVQEAFHAAREFAHNPNGWLVLIGPNGCGKTHLAAAIANQTLADGAVVLFTVVPDLLAHLRATFGPGAPEAYEQRFAKMREAEVLILDDLGAHQSSAWANEKLFQLLNYRYNSAYPTVITANKQGLAGLDERILSRISDNALVTRIIMNGALDYRPQNPRR
ncbi:MAG TPA: ATP-binding protein [Ktedonobacteraceae bacterium]|nr:ATP-binding protein [Ktedonobacteraceae bacterium]